MANPRRSTFCQGSAFAKDHLWPISQTNSPPESTTRSLLVLCRLKITDHIRTTTTKTTIAPKSLDLTSIYRQPCELWIVQGLTNTVLNSCQLIRMRPLAFPYKATPLCMTLKINTRQRTTCIHFSNNRYLFRRRIIYWNSIDKRIVTIH